MHEVEGANFKYAAFLELEKFVQSWKKHFRPNLKQVSGWCSPNGLVPNCGEAWQVGGEGRALALERPAG